MIKVLDFAEKALIEELFVLQKSSYLVEANLIRFFDIPPLKENFQELMECGETFIGYFEGGRIAGALSYTIDHKELTICRLMVAPNHFRKGFAQKLIDALDEFSRDILIIKVATGKDNLPAKRLYLKNGFSFIGDIEIEPGFFISCLEKSRTKTVGKI